MTREERAAFRVSVVLVFVAAFVYSCPTQAQARECTRYEARVADRCCNVDLRPTIDALTPRLCEFESDDWVTCGIFTVGYRWRGLPGDEFEYARKRWQIEADGDIELLASPRYTTYKADGKVLPLDVWPRDQFGIRETRLPTR